MGIAHHSHAFCYAAKTADDATWQIAVFIDIGVTPYVTVAYNGSAVYHVVAFKCSTAVPFSEW